MIDSDLPLYERIGEVIRASGKSLDEIALALKRRGHPINKGTLSRWTSGTQPLLKHLGALCCLPEVLDVPLDQRAAFHRAINRWLGVTGGVSSIAPAAYRQNTLGVVSQFTGRAAELQRLQDLVGRRQSVALAGLGGVGKTTLARQLLSTSADRFTSGCEAFVLHPRQTLLNIAVHVARRLGMSLSDDVHDAASADLLDWLSSYAAGVDLLFLLDDVNAESQVSALTQRLPGITWVFTSRRPLRLPGVELFPLEAPANDEAAGMLLSHAGLSSDETDLPLALKIAERLGNLPLALSCAAGLTTMFNSDLAALLNWLNASDLKALRLGYAHLPRFFARMLEEQPAEVRALFELCGAFTLPRISSPIFRTMARRLQLHPSGLHDLSDLSLITWPEDANHFVLHSLIHEYAAQRLRAASRYTEVRRCFSACYAESARAWRQSHDYCALQAELENVLAAAENAYAARDWDCFHQYWSPVSRQLWLNGDHSRYATFDAKFLEAARARQDRHTETQILSELGWVHMERGELAEADRALLESLAVCETLPDGAFQRARVLRYQARVAIQRGEPERALPLMQEAEKILTDLGPVEDRSAVALALIYIVKAKVNYRAGDKDQAKSDALASIDFCQRAGAEGATYLPGIHMDVGDILYGRGELDLAERHWRCTVECAPQFVEDSGTATAHARLAQLAAQRGEQEEALRFARQAHQLYAQRGLARCCIRLDKWMAALIENVEGESLFDLMWLEN